MAAGEYILLATFVQTGNSLSPSRCELKFLHLTKSTAYGGNTELLSSEKIILSSVRTAKYKWPEKSHANTPHTKRYIKWVPLL